MERKGVLEKKLIKIIKFNKVIDKKERNADLKIES